MNKEEIIKEIQRLKKLKEETTPECWLRSQMRINLIKAEAMMEGIKLTEEEFEEMIDEQIKLITKYKADGQTMSISEHGDYAIAELQDLRQKLNSQQPEEQCARGEGSDSHFKRSSGVTDHNEGFPADVSEEEFEENE